MRISDWSSDVCSSDLVEPRRHDRHPADLGAAAVYPLLERANVALALSAASDLQAKRSLGMGTGDNIPFPPAGLRSEEHTSELQSLMRISYAVFCLKKNTISYMTKKLTIYNTSYEMKY